MFDINVEIPTSFDPFAEDKDSDSPSPKGSRAHVAKGKRAPGAKGKGSYLDVLESSKDDDQILMTFDPFAEAKNVGAPGTKEYVHIRIQQRNGKKRLTTIQGLMKEFSYEKILKDLKKEFCCNGNVVQDKELGKVIQLQGDQRKNVSQFLVNADIVKKEHIKIHGF